ncbi:MAG: EamA family transporter [Actinomycetota bacterium]|nr:EamA family transporter [Actinomycetota bacterium]
MSTESGREPRGPTGRTTAAAADRAARSQATPARVWAALITVYVVWGSTYLAIREAVRTIPPFLMASARYLVAGGILFALTAPRGDREADRLGARQWMAAAIVGGLLCAGGNGMVSWAEQRIPSGIAALLVATVPLWMVAVGRLGFGMRITAREALGVVIGFGGIFLLVGGVGSGGRSFNLARMLAVVVAALCWGTGSVYSKRAALPKRALVSTAMQMLAGGAIALVVGAVTGEFGDLHPSQISLPSILGLVWLIVPGSLIAFSAYVWLLQNARISLVSTYAYVNPVVAVFLGWALLSEPVTGTTLLAGAVILAAVALIVTARPAAQKPPAPDPGAEGLSEEGHEHIPA